MEVFIRSQKNNANSMLLGSWIYKRENISQKIIFSKPDNFKCIEKDSFEQSIGKWLYSNNSVTITAFGCSFTKLKKVGMAL